MKWSVPVNSLNQVGITAIGDRGLAWWYQAEQYEPRIMRLKEYEMNVCHS